MAVGHEKDGDFLGVSSEEEDVEDQGTCSDASDPETDPEPSGSEDASASGGHDDDDFGDDDSQLDEESASDSAVEDEEEAGGGGLLAGKQASIAKAFAKILNKQLPRPAVGKGQAGEEAPGSSAPAPILISSVTVAKQKAEDEAEGARTKAAWKMMQEMRKRGHVIPGRRGEDPEADAREKALQRSATRGVVRLFNAIAGAQRKRREAEASGAGASQAARLGRASLLSKLRNPGPAPETRLVPSARGATGLVPGAPAAGTRDPASESEEEGGAGQGWEVLQRSFTGLQGGRKMKDWDRAQAAGEEEAVAGLDSSDSE